MKKTTIIYALILLISMSSCVYSLFPIYTKDTLTYVKELEGRWKLNENEFIRFSSMSGGEISIEVEPGEDEILVLDGDTIRDREQIKAYYTDLLTDDLTEKVPQLSEKGYLMETTTADDTLQFHARLVKLDEDYFLDLYPLKGGDDEYLQRNFFPVHTFMKINIKKDQFELVQFDMDKLTKLFKSNQIRLRHEKMESGVIMITAQPEEIQKFLKAYAKDQSVFEDEEVYHKIS